MNPIGSQEQRDNIRSAVEDEIAMERGGFESEFYRALDGLDIAARMARAQLVLRWIVDEGLDKDWIYVGPPEWAREWEWAAGKCRDEALREWEKGGWS